MSLRSFLSFIGLIQLYWFRISNPIYFIMQLRTKVSRSSSSDSYKSPNSISGLGVLGLEVLDEDTSSSDQGNCSSPTTSTTASSVILAAPGDNDGPGEEIELEEYLVLEYPLDALLSPSLNLKLLQLVVGELSVWSSSPQVSYWSL